jgi:hypothetical protein
MKRKSDAMPAFDGATDPDRALIGTKRPISNISEGAGTARGIVEETDTVLSEDASDQMADESETSSEADVDALDSEVSELGEEDPHDEPEPLPDAQAGRSSSPPPSF